MDEDLLPVDAFKLPYGVSTLSPSIKDDFKIEVLREKVGNGLSSVVNAKIREIKEDWNKLMEKCELNELVLSSEIRLTPKVGNIYYLYERENKTRFLSIIEPEAWGSTLNKNKILYVIRYNSDGYWEEIRKDAKEQKSKDGKEISENV